MPEIIRNGAVVDDDWQLVGEAAEVDPKDFVLPSGRILVPLGVWLARADELLGRSEAGVWLKGSDEPSRIAPWLERLPLVAIEFSKFTDGRGYSAAFLLRSRLGYRGELRAIGDVLPDQLFYMRRVGFSAFAVRGDKDIRKALALLQPFSEAYQGSWENPVPAFRRQARAWPAS